MTGGRLRILLASPAYWPARAFGGPVFAARELVRRLVEAGHEVDVVTTTIVDVHRRPPARSSRANVDGATVHYVATPLRYRWMGITPTLPLELARSGRPDVVHVFGFRDPVTTAAAAWCRARRIPYVFEPLGMFRPRLRKVRLKGALDATLYRGVARSAAAVVVASDLEAADVVAGGIPSGRVHVRGNGFPEPRIGPPPGLLRSRLGIADGAAIALYVGRIAAGKGIEHLLAAAQRLPQLHVVLVGPDDRHGVAARVHAAQADPVTAGRIHQLPPTDEPPTDLYADADVFVLASSGESFGLAAAEAAAAGVAVVVSKHCGVAGFFADDEALVVSDDRQSVVDAIARVLADQELREQLARGGVAAARRMSWDRVAEAQERIYRAAIGSG